MPVGKGSITRATNAGNNIQSMKKEDHKISDMLTMIPVNQIMSLPKDWLAKGEKHDSVTDLIPSIQKYGVIEPIIVRRTEESQFQLLSGYRRLQALKEIGGGFIISRVIENLNDKEAKGIYEELHCQKEAESLKMHEVKFEEVSKISKDMPTYLL